MSRGKNSFDLKEFIGSPQVSYENLVKQNERFVERMRRAIRLGLERVQEVTLS